MVCVVALASDVHPAIQPMFPEAIRTHFQFTSWWHSCFWQNILIIEVIRQQTINALIYLAEKRQLSPFQATEKKQ